ncbi:MAG: phosphomannomutase, partial [Candidatus Omnitrophota bacterium]
YLKFMKSYVDLKAIKKSKFHVVQDAMNGSGIGIMENVLKGSSIKLEMMRDDYNPSFGNVKPEPIEDYVPELIKRMKNEKIDLGLILDGDADRIGAVAAGGEFINAQKILGLLILHLVRNRGCEGSVVKTLCGSTMIDKICEKLNLKLHETPVGFKYISDLMVSERVIAGGEEAGGMGVQDYIPERDGNLAGLLLLEMMVKQNKNIKQILDDMEREFGRYYYLRADIDLKPGQKVSIAQFKKIKTVAGKKVVKVNDLDGVKLILEDETWLMFRPSGTEPLVRVYSEAKSLKRSKELIAFGRKAL